MNRESVANSPEYDPVNPVERHHEVRLHQHYGQTGYWEQSEPVAEKKR